MLRKGLVITTVILLPIATVLFFMSIHDLFKMKTVTVDPKLKEISGIEYDKYKRLWAINDSGDGPILYMLNKDGTIEREVTVTNAKNVDWEDMTQNSFGHFFLGDFGNNDNKRRWLTIYKIENPIDIKTDTTEGRTPIKRASLHEHGASLRVRVSAQQYPSLSMIRCKQHAATHVLVVR